MTQGALHTHLNRVQTFLAIAELGSFTKAASHLNLSRAMVSLHIKALEAALSTSLLLRNSRAVTLTEAGQSFYNEFKTIVADIDTAFDRVLHRTNRVSGTLRISSTSEYGERFILPLIPLFAERYPDIRLCYDFNSSLNDLLADRLDLVVRLGNLADSAFKSRKLADYEIVLVATEGFLLRYPVKTPQDLNAVPWIANSNLLAPTQWVLRDGVGEAVEINGSRHFQSNSSTAIRSMTLSSLGVSVLPAWMVEDDRDRGHLVRVLPEYSLPSQPISLVFADTPHLPPKSRVFIDFLLAHLGS
ncbi:DNA-binding transcriptional LysR family regulator [Pseudomonas sp. 2957]|uniref:HTH-type transcriptional regulator DmlR n=1 Tax=Pseudomonas fluorescens TaxID=294 RepID=A0A5E7PEW6_PSEFL|nr:DNA-binding transcriptional LysR family regulator [Pseudomonas sp. 2957]VVP45913.1 HTH-type transcriptional regulator DmlR [Pseudomonas fluorescens]